MSGEAPAVRAMYGDRRSALRRVQDLRDLLRFCHKFGQAVPSKVRERLGELGVADAESRTIPELLDALDELERPALARLEVDRRARRRRYLTADLDD